LISEHLFDEEVFPVCTPQLITQAKPLNQIEDLTKHCIIHSFQDKREWNAWFKMMGISKPKIESEQCFELEESSIQATLAGFGIALVNIHFIQNELSNGNLVLPFQHISPLSMISYRLLYHHSKASFLPLLKFKSWLLAEKSRSLLLRPSNKSA
jgi:LysR family glycine cleavage system transcriptional activator